MSELSELIHNANLTKTQKMIAKYILDHSADACFMTSTEIALKLNVSESSVIRFSRSLGFGGFMDFQKMLRKEYQDKVLSISSSTNTLAAFEDAADVIVAGKRKYIAASRGNACLGDYFLLYLKHILPHVSSTNTAALSPIDHMCNITKEDCLIVFSFPRYSSLDRVTTEMAKEAGASIVVITDKPSALLAQYATVLITVPVDSNAFFNSLIGPQFVAEILLDTISHKVTGIEKRLKKIDKYLDKLGIY